MRVFTAVCTVSCHTRLALINESVYSDNHQPRTLRKEPRINTTKIRATAHRAIQDLAEVSKPLTYDNVLDLTAYTLGIEMDDNDEFPAELYRKFDRMWAELNY